MVHQIRGKWGGSALIKKNAHSRGFRRMRRVFKDSASLLKRNARKPLNKLRKLRPVFEIFKESRYGNARATEYPRATDALRVPFNGRTRRPINHLAIVNLGHRPFNMPLRSDTIIHEPPQ